MSARVSLHLIDTSSTGFEARVTWNDGSVLAVTRPDPLTAMSTLAQMLAAQLSAPR